MSERRFSRYDIETIRGFYHDWGYTQRELATMYRVDRKTIYKIVNNITYKNVTLPVTFTQRSADVGHHPEEGPQWLEALPTHEGADYYDYIQTHCGGSLKPRPTKTDWFPTLALAAFTAVYVAAGLIFAHAFGLI
jgi:DNA-binding XRE family transcriptional regulator